jgi:Glu-tRNA(Gln) amidotransferase subunit E-like FAD-binding protein
MANNNVDNAIRYLDNYSRGGFYVDTARYIANLLRNYQKDIEFKNKLLDSLQKLEKRDEFLKSMLIDVETQLLQEKEEIEQLTVEFLDEINKLKNEKEISEKSAENLLACFKSPQVRPFMKGILSENMPDATGREIDRMIDNLAPLDFVDTDNLITFFGDLQITEKK